MVKRCAKKTVERIPIYLVILIGAGGVGSLYAGDEVIILGKGKTQTLAEWDKPVLFGTGSWQVVAEEEDQAIKLRAEASSFALEKSVTVDLRQTPSLEWEWKVTVPAVISYIWDPTAPKGTTAAAAGPIYLNVKAIVIQSGADQIGQWVIEKRNVVEDVRVVLGKLLNAPLPSDADPQSAYKTNGRSVLDDDTIYF